ncbi:hypothetical protein [Mycoplasma sp. 3686d]|uniref:hypothetical protein n=1 Tax=Mycoplasma sp. 3686d TaxID=2967300 RepID=UPI00211CC2AF|nr:hypothetical protein [Mycoplasma sp. 3686d]UUM24640.1 hypothetical protein NPA12_03010 [Mycoplasma sp. 3686d]
MLNKYLEDHPEQKYIDTMTARSFVFGDWDNDEIITIKKSSFYDAIYELLELDLIEYNDSLIYVKRPLHYKGWKYAHIDEPEIIKTIGLVSAKFFLTMVLTKKLINKRSSVIDVLSEEVNLKKRTVTYKKRVVQQISYAYFRARKFSNGVIRRILKSDLFNQIMSRAFETFEFIQSKYFDSEFNKIKTRSFFVFEFSKTKRMKFWNLNFLNSAPVRELNSFTLFK